MRGVEVHLVTAGKASGEGRRRVRKGRARKAGTESGLRLHEGPSGAGPDPPGSVSRSHAMRGTTKGEASRAGAGKQLPAAEMNDGLQMKGLREKVGEGDGLDLVAGGDQNA